MPLMSPHDPHRRRLDLSLTQVVAGALAAVSAAWAASALGVAGTIIGAAVVSTTISVLSAVYQHGARRTAERLRTLRKAEMEARRHQAAAAPAHDQPGATAPEPAPVPAPEPVPLDPDRTLVLPALDLEDERGYRWGRIALLSLGVFLLAMATVTVVELATGHTLACSAFGHDCEQRTSVTPGVPARPAPSPTHSTSVSPSPTPSASPTPSSTASATPSASDSASPTASPTGSPFASPSATDSLAPAAPTPSSSPSTATVPSVIPTP